MVHAGTVAQEDRIRQAVCQLVAGFSQECLEGHFILFYFGAVIEPTDPPRLHKCSVHSQGLSFLSASPKSVSCLPSTPPAQGEDPGDL